MVKSSFWRSVAEPWRLGPVPWNGAASGRDSAIFFLFVFLSDFYYLGFSEPKNNKEKSCFEFILIL